MFNSSLLLLQSSACCGGIAATSSARTLSSAEIKHQQHNETLTISMIYSEYVYHSLLIITLTVIISTYYVPTLY